MNKIATATKVDDFSDINDVWRQRVETYSQYSAAHREHKPTELLQARLEKLDARINEYQQHLRDKADGRVKRTGGIF